MLDLACASYRVDDDDNGYLSEIEAEMLPAAEEGRKRLRAWAVDGANAYRVTDRAQLSRDPSFVPQTAEEEEAEDGFLIRAGQLSGQPAGPGVAQERARGGFAARSDVV